MNQEKIILLLRGYKKNNELPKCVGEGHDMLKTKKQSKKELRKQYKEHFC